MASVHGYPGHNAKPHSLKRMASLLAFAGLIAGVLLISSKDRQSELSVILPATAVAGFFIVVSSMKITPMAWKRAFRKAEYERLLAADRRIADTLACLDDTHFVFHDVQLEFFHCDHLVIGPGGLFVIRRAMPGDEVVREDHRLAPADDGLAKAARRLWQVCHFLSMIIRKGYKTKHLPLPLFVCPGGSDGDEGKVSGVPVVALADLPARLSSARADLPKELPRSLAVFLHDRYVSR